MTSTALLVALDDVDLLQPAFSASAVAVPDDVDLTMSATPDTEDLTMSATPDTEELMTETIQSDVHSPTKSLSRSRSISLQVFTAIRTGDLPCLKVSLGDLPAEQLSEVLCSRREESCFLRRPSTGKDIFIQGPTPLIFAITLWFKEIVFYLASFKFGLDEECIVDDAANTPQVYDQVTALHLAAMSGKLDMVQSLLSNGVSVNKQTSVGDTPLYEACFEGHKSVVETLLKNGAQYDIANYNDVTCLMIGTYADNADVIKYLVERGVDVNGVDQDGRNVLFYVVAEGQLDTLAYLLDHGAKVTRDNNHVTILMEATLHGRVDAVEYLVKFDSVLGMSPEDTDHMGRNALFYLVHCENLKLLEVLLAWGVMIQPASDGRTLLMNATLKGNKTLVKYLVTNAGKLGVNLDERDTKGRNCLFYCVTGGDLDLFDFLTSNGVPVNNSEDDVTLLIQSVAKNRADFTNMIIQECEHYGIELNAKDKDGWDAPMYAIASGHVHLFKSLVMSGVQCHQANDGRTILMQAAARGDVGLVRYILDNASDFQIFANQRDTDGWNSLFYTVQGGHMETFKFLLRRGSKVCSAINGSTLLMEAVDKNRMEFVEYLLANAQSLGIDICGTDREGNNALFYAAAGGQVAMIQRLVKAGCPVNSDAHDRTLVMQAALHGHVGMVEFLVNNSEALRLDLQQNDKDERNVLFYSVEGGHIDVLDLLLRVGVKPRPDKCGRTNLMQAARAGNTKVLDYLLQNHKRLQLDINAKDSNGENALFFAVRSKDTETVTKLLQNGVMLVNNNNGIGVLAQSLSEGKDDVVHAILTHAQDLSGAMSGRDTKGRTVLHHYVERGDLEMLHNLSKYYLENRDNDLMGATLLMCACKHTEYLHIVKYLIEQLKVPPSKVDFRNRCALFYAVESSNIEATVYVLEYVDKVESDKDGLSPLMVATASGDPKVVEALLKSKLCKDLVNRTDKRGRNEVHYCAIHGYTPILEILHYYGSNMDIRDVDGMTPIMCACANGRYQILLALLRKGADVDATDGNRQTALHLCFGSNPSLNCVKVLVKFDVKLNHQDTQGVSALMLACQTCAKSIISIIRFLIDYGADPIAQDKEGKDSFDYCPFDAEYVKAVLREGAGMEKSQWLALEKYRSRLIQDIELNSVLRGLIKERIFTKTLHFEVMKKCPAERVDRLLELLRVRGDRAFRAFCKILKDEYEIELAFGLLKEAYRKDEEIFW